MTPIFCFTYISLIFTRQSAKGLDLDSDLHHHDHHQDDDHDHHQDDDHGHHQDDDHGHHDRHSDHNSSQHDHH